MSKLDFRNTSQNQKAVKIKRYEGSHNKFSIRSLPTLFSIIIKMKKKVGIKRKEVFKWFSKNRVKIEKQSKKSERDSRYHTKFKIKGPPTQISRHFFGKIPRQIRDKCFHTNFEINKIYKNVGKKPNECQRNAFRNSSQNRKAD